MNAKEAKKIIYTNSTSKKESYKNSIYALIHKNAAENLMHCDYYSSATTNLSQIDIDMFDDIVNDLINKDGYKVRKTLFEPNDTFNNYRIKLHINWE